MKRFVIYTLLVFSFTLYALRLQGIEIDFIPMGSVSLLGGQYFFEKEAASFGGNAYLELAPSLQFTDELSLIPTYSLAYRGTKNVTELVGGGTLTQQAQDHLISLRLVNQMNDDLKVKLNTSYKLELLKETEDESWGNGLFDYYKIAGGIEAENKFRKKLDSLTAGYGYYVLKFNNYASLAEAKYGKEVSPGKNILDFGAHEAYLYSNFVFNPDIQLKGNYSFTYKTFGDQKIVTNTGDYSSDKRWDQIHLLNLLLSHLHEPKRELRFAGYVGMDITSYRSNQNHYDAKKFKFIPDYYNYLELAFKPGVSVQFGKKRQTIDFSYQYASRNYPKRVVQDSTGEYLTDKINTNTSTISIGTTYPLKKKINLRLQVDYLKSSSNMKYEKTYRYNYDTSNYFLGISLEY